MAAFAQGPIAEFVPQDVREEDDLYRLTKKPPKRKIARLSRSLANEIGDQEKKGIFSEQKRVLVVLSKLTNRQLELIRLVVHEGLFTPEFIVRGTNFHPDDVSLSIRCALDMIQRHGSRIKALQQIVAVGRAMGY